MNKQQVCEALHLLCDAMDFSQDLHPGEEDTLPQHQKNVLKAVRLGRTLADRIERGVEREGYTALMKKVRHTLTIDWSVVKHLEDHKHGGL